MIQVNMNQSHESQENYLYHDDMGSSNRFGIRLEGNIYIQLKLEKCFVPGLPLSVDWNIYLRKCMTLLEKIDRELSMAGEW